MRESFRKQKQKFQLSGTDLVENSLHTTEEDFFPPLVYNILFFLLITCEKSSGQSANNRSFGSPINFAEKFENNAVSPHGIQNSRQRKHCAK